MRATDILGMNERNLRYIRVYNRRDDIRVVDDKLATKEVLRKTGIKTPRVYGAIQTSRDLKTFDWNKLPVSFVVKPDHGFGGEGVMVLRSFEKKKEFMQKTIDKRVWLKSENEEVTFENLKSHILDILDGRFSLAGIPDVAFFERKIILHPLLKKYVYKGIPDVRVIVFNKVPVMSMLRLPTRMSKGKANLAQGAVGVGVDIATGVTTHAIVKVPKRAELIAHPDTGQKLVGFQVPFWEEILKMSIESQQASGLGFIGVDIAVDSKFGPEILELNARPGLEIQNANLLGLARRLERVSGLAIRTIDHGVRISKELFGAVSTKKAEVKGRKVLGSVEKVKVLSKNGKSTFEILAKIDTGAASTSIDLVLAKKLGYGDLLDLISNYKLDSQMTDIQAEKAAKKAEKELKALSSDVEKVNYVRSAHGLTLRPYIKLAFFVASEKKISIVNLSERGLLKYQMIIGMKDLKGYLVNVEKKH